jgi:hypothetical protein
MFLSILTHKQTYRVRYIYPGRHVPENHSVSYSKRSGAIKK